MKTCPNCQITKDYHCFSKHRSRADGYQIWCKECNKTPSRNYYNDNREKHKKTTRQRKSLVRDDLLPEKDPLLVKVQGKTATIKIIEYLLDHPCVDCNENNIIVLEFDHINPSEKSSNISVMASGNYSWKRIKEEIDKCEVRCANCHKIKTAEQQGWKKSDKDLVEQIKLVKKERTYVKHP